MPGHTPGMQSVRVHTARGWVVLASDAAHYYESLDPARETPFLTHVDLSSMLESFRRLHRLAPSPAHIVPGHDPLVLKRYPPPAPGLEGIVVRLDVAPSA
jgi:glyoxylase-like metal-dependent hydrolase (beta-lactamase superfamily II)